MASAAALRRCRRGALPGGAGAILLLATWRASGQDGTQAVLLAVAAAIGVTLYHSAFGFTGAYRALLVERDGRGVRAQLLMLAIATVLFAPLLAAGEVHGTSLAGAWAPAGISVATGAFLFGVGMQLAGGCGSGTLYAVGGGSVRMLATLAAFCAGGFWASLHLGWWQGLPAASAAPLSARVGWTAAVVIQLAVLGMAWWALRRIDCTGSRDESRADWHLVKGPWPLVAGALLLAVLNTATLIIAGHPWSITWGFTLWGAKAAQALGWDPAASAFWTSPFAANALGAPLLADTTSLMNVGIVLGALIAASLAGRATLKMHFAVSSLVPTIAGGLAMGYGARIAFGCNIGAFFSGIASTSLHGWLWILAALPGMWLGVRLCSLRLRRST